MMDTMDTTNALALLSCLGTATVGGVFFAFSTFVMKALDQRPPNEGVAAMQRINVVVINPLFVGVFAGSAVVTTMLCAMAFFPWTGSRSSLIVAAFFSYVVGSFGVTMAFNVPRNNRLAALDSGSVEAADYWPVYVREWTRWNHVRTVASLVSAACAAGSLAI